MYAERHVHLFKDYIIPRDENFNPEVQGGVSWVRELPRLNETVIADNDEFQRSRLRALQYVDEMVENAIKMPDEVGQLENTYIFYTTDNGYHFSQHRMHPGKECGFETDVHIPPRELVVGAYVSSFHWTFIICILFSTICLLIAVVSLEKRLGKA